MRNRVLLAVTLISALCNIGCSRNSQAEQIARATTGGSAARGATAISRYGCGSCHIIPGVSGASGLAGPPLSGIGNRIYIAGVLQNTPDNMIRWIENPPAVDEHTVMPNLGVRHQDAIDIAGYLYTLQ
ncbi:MAG: c-type cytochrome [Acidobacteriaceae bacterium]|nr:c-type cytochrome [Acidobacteriaceae bacterium]